MATVNIEETLRAGISGVSTGDAVNSFTGYLATLFVYELPFNDERLSDVGKIKIAVELGGCPDLADLGYSGDIRNNTVASIFP